MSAKVKPVFGMTKEQQEELAYQTTNRYILCRENGGVREYYVRPTSFRKGGWFREDHHLEFTPTNYTRGQAKAICARSGGTMEPYDPTRKFGTQKQVADIVYLAKSLDMQADNLMNLHSFGTLTLTVSERQQLISVKTVLERAVTSLDSILGAQVKR